MQKKRKSLWNADSRAEYTETTERLARESVAERNGEPAAENLETIWSALAEEEKHFIEYLFLSEKRIVVALFEDKLFSGLMSKSLLRIPQGVSTVFIQSHQTTYSIPRAVWKTLIDRSDLFFSNKGINKARRIEELTRQFDDRVEVLITGADPKADG